MNIKLLLLDLDDTLLNSKGELSDKIIKTVHRVRDKGIIVAIASGRMHVSLLPYIELLNTHGPVISYNGALIKDSTTNKTISCNPIPLSLAKEVLKFAKHNEVYCQYYDTDNYYFDKHSDLSNKYASSTGVRGIDVGDNLHTKIVQAPPKILIINKDENTDELLKKAQNRFGKELEVTRSKPMYIEIMSYNTNKGAALKSMCEYFDIPLSETMAIGDGQNDIQMIKKAGVGVAVATGNELLKKEADVICDGPDDNGPARIIEEYLL
jgi:Cof subfamily protein (haloacid dehalogenase superfamily)